MQSFTNLVSRLHRLRSEVAVVARDVAAATAEAVPFTLVRRDAGGAASFGQLHVESDKDWSQLLFDRAGNSSGYGLVGLDDEGARVSDVYLMANGEVRIRSGNRQLRLRDHDLPLMLTSNGSTWISVPRIASGRVNIEGTGNSVAVTFPAGRFTSTPDVIISGAQQAASPPQDVRAVVSGTTGFTAYYYRADGGSAHTGARNFDWIAVQT